MKTFFFEELESTSSTAGQWLEQKKQAAPFAIVAASQEKGRGRQGRSWQSPAGNIYFSVALSGNALGLNKIQLLPLKVGALLALWMRDQFGLAVSLKWPNDLFFGPRKLGGILCESSVRGQTIASAVAGVGINLNKSPRLQGEYGAVSLSQILGKPLDVERQVKALLKFWDAHWENLNDEAVIATYRQYSMEDGHLWRDTESDRYFSSAGIATDGSLMLESLENEELVTVNSVSHPYRWVFQESNADNMPITVCDIGNTQIKIARFAHPREHNPQNFSAYPVATFAGAALKALLPPHPHPVFVASVNNEGLVKLQKVAQGLGRRVVRVRKRQIRVWGDNYAFANIGEDRVAAMEAAVLSFQGKAFVVVAAGTATTIDAVSSQGEHLGGWIIPGIRTGLWSLYEKTDALPNLENILPAKNYHRFGFDTASAMLNGVVHMSHGAIGESIKLLAKHEKCDAADIGIIATGGFAEWLKGDRKNFKIDPHLVCRGVRILALGGGWH